MPTPSGNGRHESQSPTRSQTPTVGRTGEPDAARAATSTEPTVSSTQAVQAEDQAADGARVEAKEQGGMMCVLTDIDEGVLILFAAVVVWSWEFGKWTYAIVKRFWWDR